MKRSVVFSVVIACSAVGSAYAQVSEADFNKLKERVEALEKASAAHGDDLAIIKKRLGEIAKDMGTVVERVADTDAKLKDLVKPDVSNPNRGVVDLLGNMERSAAFRADVDKITTGRLVIENPTGADQYMYINGTLWRVIPGRSFAPVNRGVVTVQRPGVGAEVLSNWQFDAARGYFVSYTVPPSAYPVSVAALSPVIYWP
jgi:tetrahydromethanopterin S-methyltransferase subunit G